MADNNRPAAGDSDPRQQYIGKKLIQENIITQAQLDEALTRQRVSGGRVGDNLIELGYLTQEQFAAFLHKRPMPPKTIQETGLEAPFLADLALKHILLLGEFKIPDLADAMKLPGAVVDSLVDLLQQDNLIEVKGAPGYARLFFRFAITGLGQRRAAELMDMCRYVGPAPVSLESYRDMILEQTIKNVVVYQDELTQAFSHLVINAQVLRQLGPALTSGRAIFLYGPPGNGKTSIAETIGNVLPQTVYIPYALYVAGQLISVYDPINHTAAAAADPGEPHDRRWLLIRRPVIIVGGELTLKTLDLEFNPIAKFYTAPLQMKANNGLFIIDDFGRQQVDPTSLLNRWIVPLERRIDFMTLHTGMKFEIPFDQLVVFSTNLEPRDLVDEAFLRRIRYKIKIDYPSAEEFATIFNMVCQARGVAFSQEVFDFLKEHFYQRLGVRPSANHPQDLIDHIIDQSRYYRHSPELTVEGIKAAWESYFVEL